MIKKVLIFLGAAACTGLIVIFVPGFADEIAAGVMPVSKIQLGIEHGASAIGPPDGTCSHDPWPYGCNWRASTGRKQIVKKVLIRHHRYAQGTLFLR